jgi:cell division protein FtsQ
MDKDGVVFAAFTAKPKGLPVVEIRAVSGDRAHQEAASVVQALPAEVLDRLKRLKAESIDSIELVLTDGRQVKWGSSDQSARKVEVLEVLLQHPAQVYDVSVPEQPTTRNL